MADSDALVRYKPLPTPTIKGGEAVYLKGELESLRTTVASICDVIVKLEARLAAGGH